MVGHDRPEDQPGAKSHGVAGGREAKPGAGGAGQPHDAARCHRAGRDDLGGGRSALGGDHAPPAARRCGVSVDGKTTKASSSGEVEAFGNGGDWLFPVGAPLAVGTPVMVAMMTAVTAVSHGDIR